MSDLQKSNSRGSHSQSPSLRATSDSASLNEDWTTAVGSVQDSRSIRSLSQSPETVNGASQRDRPAASHQSYKTQGTGALAMNGPSRHSTASRSSSLDERDQANIQTRSYRPGNRLSSANLRRQTEIAEDELKTPQAKRTRRLPSDDGRSAISAAPSNVYDELEDLKRRINKLEFAPAALAETYPSHRSQFSRASYRTPESRPDTADSYATSTFGRSGSQISPRSPGHMHPLLRTTMNRLRMSDLDPDLLRPLDIAVSDALVLASSTAHTPARYRSDGLCRSLTEVCLFLLGSKGQHVTNPDGIRSSSGISRSNTFSGHDRETNLSAMATMPRSSSNRKSLAEIVRGREYGMDGRLDVPDGRSASRMSQLSEYRPSTGQTLRGTSMHHETFYGQDSASERRHAGTAMSFRDAITRDLPVDYPSSLRERDNSVHSRIHSSAGHHSRSQSRAATEILDRSPITRETLYSRYQRTPPDRRL